MAIHVTSIQHAREQISGSSYSLRGNVFDKITTTIDFYAQKLVDATVDNEIEFAVDGFGSLDYIQMVNGGGDFADFQIGDPIVVFGGVNGGTYTIIGKPDDSTIQVNAALTNVVENSVIIYVNYVQNAVDFQFGLVENNEPISFVSKTSNDVNRYKIDFANASFQSMTPVGAYKSWQIGDAEIKTMTSAYAWQFHFQLVHTYYINPFFLFTQSTSTAPDYFLNNKALRYVFRLETKPFYNFTEGINQGEFELFNGFTGWLNENLNTGITNYNVSNVTYTKVSDSSPLQGVLLSSSETTRVNFTVNNTIDTPFSNGNTPITCHVINVPFEQAEYQANANTLDQNFTYDRAANLVGDPAISGQFGRCITNFEATFVSASQIDVSFDVTFTPSDQARIFAYDDKKFLIAFGVADHTKSINLTDCVTLLLDYNDYAINLGTDNAVTLSYFKNYNHPNHVSKTTQEEPEVFLEDEIVSDIRVKIDTSQSVYTHEVISFESGVRLYNTVTQDVTELDSVNYDATSTPIVNGSAYISHSEQRAFQAQSSEPIKQYNISRNLGLDAPNTWYYDIQFPFLVGWEYWQNNPLIPSDFFNVAEPNNGLNNRWLYVNANYVIQVYTNVVLRFNGVDYLYTVTKNISPKDYMTNPDWDNDDIKSYDIATSTDITNCILGFDKTKIIAQIDYVGSGTPPLVNEVEWVLRLEPKENGGRFVSTRFSSVYTMTSNTQWESSDTSNLIIKSVVGTTYYAEAVIDNALLQSFGEFDITARIYETTSGGGCLPTNLLAEDGDCLLTEDSQFIIPES